MTEEDHDLIDLFLTGEMTSAERDAFELRIQKEVSLRQHVNLRRELMAYVGSEEPALVESIREADRKHYADSGNKKSGGFLKWGFLITALLLFLAGWWLFPTAPEKEILPVPETATTPVDPPVIIVDTATTLPAGEDTLSSPASTTFPGPAAAPPAQEVPRSETPPPTQKNPTLPTAEPQDSVPDRPIYAALNPADFAANPLLENLIGGTLRSTPDSTSLLVYPGTDTLQLAALDAATIKVFTTFSPPFEIVLFDSKESSFLEDNALLRTKWKELPGDDGTAFTLPIRGITRPGRYYILLLDEGGELLKATKFLVR